MDRKIKHQSIVQALALTNISVKKQLLAAIGAMAAAVVLPQLFHMVGLVSDMGTALGETFLPMHLPILLVGLIAGPYAGAVAGLLSPLISFGLTGMPGKAMLPFIMLELCMYGFITGLLRTRKLPVIVKLLIAQLGGRGIRAAAILAAVYLFGNESVHVSVIVNSIIAGIPGLILQWSILPLLVYRIEGGEAHETDIYR